MSMISSPPIGATAYGVSGQAYQVMQIVDDRAILTCPSGTVRAPLSAIVRWELPPPTEVPPPEFQPGDPLEVYFPHVQEWRGGFTYLEPHRNPEKCWLTDSQGIEHSSRLEWVRRDADL
jgi:hypothetical protein